MSKNIIEKLIKEELKNIFNEDFEISDDANLFSNVSFDDIMTVRFIRGGQITELVFRDPNVASKIFRQWTRVKQQKHQSGLRVVSFYDGNVIQLHTDQLVYYTLNILLEKQNVRKN